MHVNSLTILHMAFQRVLKNVLEDILVYSAPLIKSKFDAINTPESPTLCKMMWKANCQRNKCV